MQSLDEATRDDASVQTWLAALPDGAELADTVARLRAAVGGLAAPGGNSALAAAYFRPGKRGPEALRALLDDPSLRREVAAIGRLLDADAMERDAARPNGNRRWWVGGTLLAVAASLLLLAVRPLQVGPHRSVTIARDELRLLTPAGVRPTAPAITWARVLTADQYTLEVTAADGRPVYTAETMDTLAQIPDGVLEPGTSYFFRVRARLDAGRWVASEFRELVVQP